MARDDKPVNPSTSEEAPAKEGDEGQDRKARRPLPLTPLGFLSDGLEPTIPCKGIFPLGAPYR